MRNTYKPVLAPIFQALFCSICRIGCTNAAKYNYVDTRGVTGAVPADIPGWIAVPRKSAPQQDNSIREAFRLRWPGR